MGLPGTLPLRTIRQRHLLPPVPPSPATIATTAPTALQLRKLGVTNYFVFCLDTQLQGWLDKRGINTFFSLDVAYHNEGGAAAGKHLSPTFNKLVHLKTKQVHRPPTTCHHMPPTTTYHHTSPISTTTPSHHQPQSPLQPPPRPRTLTLRRPRP